MLVLCFALGNIALANHLGIGYAGIDGTIFHRAILPNLILFMGAYRVTLHA